jgi:hypothetical protein
VATTQTDVNRARALYAQTFSPGHPELTEDDRRERYDELQRVKAQFLIDKGQALLASIGEGRAS